MTLTLKILTHARLELVEAAVEQLATTKDRRSEPRSAAEAERRKRGA